MRILVVERQSLCRKGLVELLATQSDIQVVGEAGNSWEALGKVDRLNPDLIILDSQTPLDNNLEALRILKEAVSDTRFLMLASSEEEEYFWQALRYGVHGYLLNPITPEELFQALRGVMRGETVVSPLLAGKLLAKLLAEKERQGRDPQAKLTGRESEILELLSTGISDREIGNQLSLSSNTVRHHVHNILRKLGLRNRVQAAIFVNSRGLPRQYGWGDK